jgi:acetyl esterase/lipase
MKTLTLSLNEVTGANMTMYLADESEELGLSMRPLMLVLPGGGYSMCSDREAEPVALAYTREGYNACVLRYTTKDQAPWPAPLNDYERCVEIIEEHADQWHVDMAHYAVVGFSAGGHLAACAATVAQHKPKAAVLVYPAIDKEICDYCQPGMVYPAQHVDGKTAPCFIVAARDDSTVPVSSSLHFAEALEQNGIAFELHIVNYGQHGFSLANDMLNTNEVSPRLPRWVSDSQQWLGEMMGNLTRTGFTEPKLPSKINGDQEEYLSVFCTLGHIRKQGSEVQTLLQPLYDAMEALAKVRGYNPAALFLVMSTSTVKMLLEILSFPKADIDRFQKELKTIPNQL